MDAVGGETRSLRDKVEGAQSALARSIAKANLTGDPLGPALEAMSESLGAQLALHQANTAHFRDVTERLDVSVVDAVHRGEQALAAKRVAIVEALAPELAKITARSVRSWNRTITLRTGVTLGAFAVALALGVGMAGYGAGWQAGHNTALGTAGILAVAVQRAGPGAEAGLVAMVRANNLPDAWAKCQQSATPDKTGRRVCLMPMWAQPQGQPDKG